MILILAVFLVAALTFAQDAFDLGRWSIITFEKGSIANPDPLFDPFHLRVWAPVDCENQCGEWAAGDFPVLLVSTGFAATIPSVDYEQLLASVARHGIVVVAMDKDREVTLTTDYWRLAVPVLSVINYIKVGTFKNDVAFFGGTSAGIKVNKIYVGGHSTGAHLMGKVVQTIVRETGGCPGIGGFVAWNPLDGQDPLGFGGDFLFDEKNPTNFKTSIVIVSGDLENTATSLYPGAPCGPDERAAPHFYENWKGAKYWIKATNVGHLTTLDENALTFYDDYCKDDPLTLNQRIALRTMYKGAAVAFLEGVDGGNQFSLNKLHQDGDLNFANTHKWSTAESNNGVCELWVKPDTPTAEVQLGMLLFGIMFGLTCACGLWCFFRRVDEESRGKFNALQVAEFGEFGDGPLSSVTHTPHGISFSLAQQQEQIKQRYSSVAV